MLLNKKGQGTTIAPAMLDVVLVAIMLVVGTIMISFTITNVESQNQIITENLEYKILASRLLTTCAVYDDGISGVRPGVLELSKLTDTAMYSKCFGPEVEFRVQFENRVVTSGGQVEITDAFPVIIKKTNSESFGIVEIGLGFQ